MAKITYNICVLIVTYSDRWQFLEQVITRVSTFENVTNIVIVDNASTYSVAENCARLGDQRIKVLTNADNLGSAGGYKLGLEYFKLHTDAEFVWLLDDDNQPVAGALQELTDAWAVTTGAEDRKALFSLRPDRKQHVMIAHGADVNRFFAAKNSFMGFHLFRIPVNQYAKLKAKFAKAGSLKKMVQMPYVPYGGLFFHKKMIDLIGYPEEQFFVYADDSEYTCRITKKGGRIWLIPSSKITDVDTSYGISYHRRLWRSVYLDLWGFRTYYQVRNSVYFYDRMNVTSPFLYGINKWMFLTGLWVVSLVSGKRKNYGKFLNAIDDGIAGRLGMVNSEKYS